MQQIIILFARLQDDIPYEENQFPPITELLEVLDKYKVEVSDESRRLHALIKPEWAKYLELLEDAGKMIEISKVLRLDAKNLKLLHDT